MRRFVGDRVVAALDRARPALEDYISQCLEYPLGFPVKLAPAAVVIREFRQLKLAPLAKADLPPVQVEVVLKAWLSSRAVRNPQRLGPRPARRRCAVDGPRDREPRWHVQHRAPVCCPQGVVARHGKHVLTGEKVRLILQTHFKCRKPDTQSRGAVNHRSWLERFLSGSAQGRGTNAMWQACLLVGLLATSVQAQAWLITAGRGLGPLQLGVTQDAARNILGPPDSPSTGPVEASGR
jgi:hypothetical protein